MPPSEDAGVACDADLVAWYRFEPAGLGPGDLIADACRRGHDAVLAGTGLSTRFPDSALAGLGSVLHGDDTSGTAQVLLDVNTSDLAPAAALTIEVWANQAGDSWAIVRNGSYRFYSTFFGVGFEAYGTLPNFLTEEAAWPTQDSAWHHYAVSFDSGSARMYVDGIAVATTTTGATPAIADSGDVFFIFIDGDVDAMPNTSFDVWVDEVKVWRTARTERDICGDAGGEYVDGASPACLLPAG
jgi:hypothetical protein